MVGAKMVEGKTWQMEEWPRGRWRHLGKVVKGNLPWVRIPLLPSNIGVSSNGRIAVSKTVNGGSSPSALASPQYLDDILVLGRAQSGLFVTSQLEECNGIIL